MKEFLVEYKFSTVHALPVGQEWLAVCGTGRSSGGKPVYATNDYLGRKSSWGTTSGTDQYLKSMAAAGDLNLWSTREGAENAARKMCHRLVEKDDSALGVIRTAKKKRAKKRAKKSSRKKSR
jgi:hypothetical protein